MLACCEALFAHVVGVNKTCEQPKNAMLNSCVSTYEGYAHDRYKDIRELMKRCETLVVTRDDAKAAVKHFTDEVHVQETELVELKEA